MCIKIFYLQFYLNMNYLIQFHSLRNLFNTFLIHNYSTLLVDSEIEYLVTDLSKRKVRTVPKHIS